MEKELSTYNLQIAEAKVQHGPTFKYLGTQIIGNEVKAQPLKLDPSVENLHDVQK